MIFAFADAVTMGPMDAVDFVGDISFLLQNLLENADPLRISEQEGGRKLSLNLSDKPTGNGLWLSLSGP